MQIVLRLTRLYEMKKARWWLIGFAVLVVLGFVAHRPIYDALQYVRLILAGKSTVDERLAQYGPAARARLKPYFDTAGIRYPPARMVLAGFKKEKVLELYASDTTDSLRFIRSYSVLAASGKLGPKLTEGDRQVPEGLYRIEFLNPNSRYHLSLRLDYPNSFDRAQADLEGRHQLGGDIMIHGSDVSIGCLAIGDPAIEELFVLVADSGRENASVVISPLDLRKTNLPPNLANSRPWLAELYNKVKTELSTLPLPSE